MTENTHSQHSVTRQPHHYFWFPLSAGGRALGSRPMLDSQWLPSRCHESRPSSLRMIFWKGRQQCKNLEQPFCSTQRYFPRDKPLSKALKSLCRAFFPSVDPGRPHWMNKRPCSGCLGRVQMSKFLLLPYTWAQQVSIKRSHPCLEDWHTVTSRRSLSSKAHH